MYLENIYKCLEGGQDVGVGHGGQPVLRKLILSNMYLVNIYKCLEGGQDVGVGHGGQRGLQRAPGGGL